jgi:serine/threonine protein kinase
MLKLTAHPSREELSAYSLGQLPEERAVAIDTHISQCEPCCETIVELSSEDTFAGLLREAGRLQTDQTFESESVPDKSSAASEDIPTPLAEHSRYEIVRLIGKGGMGDVYEARHRMMERTVALKVIKHELMQKPEAVDRFHREVKAAAQLAHPNVVTAYDAEQAGDVHFLVMEYVDGVDLSRTVKDRGALPVAEACDYVRQAAVGLQYAHERGMVHRDIKPHNLMVTVDGTVKILDFGLASLARERIADADTVEIRGDLTAVGAIMGTPDFISPEQANDARQADIRSDIYSLGATLYFLLSGHPPFAEGSVMHKLKSHAQAEPKPLDSLRDDVPPELVDIVTKMTAKDPEERYLTPSQVAEALESFLRDWRQEQDQPPRPKSSSGGDMSGTGGQKPGTGDMSPEWLPVAAKWLSYVMWIPVGLLVWETVFFDASSDASDVRVIIYVVASILLSTVAGALGAAQRLNSEMDQTTRGDRRIFGMKADDAWLVAAILIGAIFAAVYFM